MNSFKIIGISVETTNQNGQSGVDLEKLWGKFWGENIQDQITNKVNDDIYAVYTDYESDYTGKYTTIIGVPVNSLECIPNGFMGREFTLGKYKKFVSIGKMPEAVLNTWMEIWNDNELRRSYSADVTVHGQKYYDGDHAEVETYISVTD